MAKKIKLGLAVLALCVTTMCLSVGLHADSPCYLIEKDTEAYSAACTSGTGVTCAKGAKVVYEGGFPTGCNPSSVTTQVHSGPFHCRPALPPTPETYLQCIDEFYLDLGGWQPVVYLCTTYTDCILRGPESGSPPYCDGGPNIYNYQQGKITIACTY
jgi:hypothetical protein